MNTFTAPFIQKYRLTTALATLALGGLGTSAITGAVELATGAANGSIVTRITAMPRATVTASSLDLFIVKASAPGVYIPVDSELMAAYTQAVTTAVPETTFGNVTNAVFIPLEAGDKLFCGSEVALAAGIAFVAVVGDF